MGGCFVCGRVGQWVGKWVGVFVLMGDLCVGGWVGVQV